MRRTLPSEIQLKLCAHEGIGCRGDVHPGYDVEYILPKSGAWHTLVARNRLAGLYSGRSNLSNGWLKKPPHKDVVGANVESQRTAAAGETTVAVCDWTR
jgi:hypothetical protein